MQGFSIVTALAESNEGCVWIFQLRLAAFKPEIPPFLLKVINIIARRYDLGVIVGFLIKRRKHSRFRGRQRLHGSAVRESYVVSIKPDRIVRDMVMHGVFITNFAYQGSAHDSRAAAGRHHTPPSLSLAASPEGYDDGKQRWLYAASEPNLVTIGMHSLSPGPFPCNTLPWARNA